MDRLNKKLTVGQKFKIGAGIGFVVFVVVLEKKRVDRLLENCLEVISETERLSQEAVKETMWRSFDEGVKYGLTLEKTVNIVRDGKDYAFGAFDKPS